MKKILIIEDDRILLETAADFLREEGFEVIKAEDGEFGIQRALSFLPDLILCDIYMPKFDGYQVFAKLQSTISTSTIPFIFMTAKAEQEDIRYGMGLGADDYITKPINFKELKKSVNARIEKYGKNIQRSEAKYHALFELANDAILIIRPPEGTILDANQTSLKMLGYQKQELLGTKGTAILIENCEDCRAIQWEKGQKPESFFIEEMILIHKDGRKIPVQVSGTHMENLDEPLFMLIIRDMTDLMAKETALKESEERYRDLVENTGEGLGVVDTQENFKYANPAACDIFGLPEETLIGKSLLTFLDPLSIEEIARQTSIRKEGQKSMYELEITRHDGERRWIIVTATPQYDSNRNFISTFGIFRDITQRKMAENKLRESEQRLREIVDLTNDWIWEIDPQWKYIFVSQKVVNILGYSREEMIGKSPFDFLLPEDIEQVAAGIREIVHQYKPLNSLIARARHKDGNIIYLETSGVAVFDEKGNYKGYRGADRDITLRKLYEKELIISKEKAEESDRLKSSILANMSHELRTPLNGIVGFAEILREELRDSDYEGMVENIHSSGKRLMLTLNSIITLSQLEAGKVNVIMKEVDLKAGIISLVNSFDSQVKEKKITVDLFGLKQLRVITDEHLLKQLLRQLIDNAIKFTDYGQIILDSAKVTRVGRDWVVIRITDTGIGIDKQYYEIIFQEFRQVSEGFSRKYQGSGIGLTISKKIIDLLKGEITLESEPGRGSSFSIWLPCNQSLLNPEESTASLKPTVLPKTPQAITGLPLILLVEDNHVNTELTEFFLFRFYVVESAKDGATALEMARRKNYAAILMDINLGYGMNGLEATKEIRNIPGYEKTPIIAVTGYTMDEDRDRLLAEGCTHYIAKPFDKTTLLNLLKEALSTE
ncbi:MAG: PAS domain S-box protein [Bacteroidota bacterium]